MRWLSLVLLVGCGGATVVEVREDGEVAPSPCADRDRWQEVGFASDDPGAEDAAESFGPVAPCLDEAGEDKDCAPSVQVRIVANDNDATRYDAWVYRSADDHLAVATKVYDDPSAEGCAWDNDTSAFKVGPWVIARRAGTVMSRDGGGCSDEGVGSVFAIADGTSGAFVGVVTCMGDAAAKPVWSNGRLTFEGCRGGLAYREDELRACVVD